VPLNIDQLRQRAKEYVELEASTEVMDVEFVETFMLFGRQDAVLSVKTTDKEVPEWWVVGGNSPLNLYDKNKFGSADEAFSFHTGLLLRMLALQDDEAPEAVGYDAFICHASEDKEEIVRPLAEKLIELGFKIWYDEFELKVGDSLRQSIDRGLAISEYGIVVLSEAFFAKNWPQYELNGLVAREIEGRKVILPVWHRIDKAEILKYSPPLADKVAAVYPQLSLDEIAEKLADVLTE
jgi:hypothetical protein